MTTQASRSSKSGKTTISLEFYSQNGIVMGLESVANRAPQNFIQYMQRKANEAEVYMKANHPWHNRTGRAERGLHATVESVTVGGEALVQIGLWHSDVVWPWYGKYLEGYALGGDQVWTAIIKPTQQALGPKMLEGLNLSELYRFTGNPKA